MSDQTTVWFRAQVGESAREVTDPANYVVNGEPVGGSHPCANLSLEPGRVPPKHSLPESTVANPSLEPGRVLPEPTLPALTVASPSGPHDSERNRPEIFLGTRRVEKLLGSDVRHFGSITMMITQSLMLTMSMWPTMTVTSVLILTSPRCSDQRFQVRHYCLREFHHLVRNICHYHLVRLHLITSSECIFFP